MVRTLKILDDTIAELETVLQKRGVVSDYSAGIQAATDVLDKLL